MQRGRYTKIVVRTAAFLAALLLGIVALSVLDNRRTQGELGAVLSDFFSERLLRDIHDSRFEGRIQVIVLRGGPKDATYRDRWLNLAFDRKPPFPQASPVTRSSFFLSNAVTTEMRTELPPRTGLDFVVVSRSELQHGQPGDFERRFPNNFGHFAISQAGLNFSKTEAIFYVDHYCGGLCGGGAYVLMRKVNGVWSVVAEQMTWES